MSPKMASISALQSCLNSSTFQSAPPCASVLRCPPSPQGRCIFAPRLDRLRSSANFLASFILRSASIRTPPRHRKHFFGMSFSRTHLGARSTSQGLILCPHSRYIIRRRQMGQSWWKESCSSHWHGSAFCMMEAVGRRRGDLGRGSYRSPDHSGEGNTERLALQIHVPVRYRCCQRYASTVG